MPGLDPGIHVFASGWKAWMAGSSPAMTERGKPLAYCFSIPASVISFSHSTS